MEEGRRRRTHPRRSGRPAIPVAVCTGLPAHKDRFARIQRTRFAVCARALPHYALRTAGAARSLPESGTR